MMEREMQKNSIHTPALLEYDHVSISYGKREVVHDVSLSMQPGEILGIVGESGSGKSTVIKAAMGLLGNHALINRGDIYYKGENVADAGADALRRLRGPQMGMIFQDAGASLNPIRTIGEQLAEAVQVHESCSRQEIKERATKLLEVMKLPDADRILKSYPFELSGGMNQRVGIMMAMILNPDLLFADEPTSALDVTVQAQIIREMMAMRDAFGVGIAIVTHNIGVVEYMADNVAVMYQGNLVEYGRKEDVIGDPKHPYTKQLLGAVLRLER